MSTSSSSSLYISPNPNFNTTPPNPNIPSSTHRRNDSGELDVFEAARYFSAQETLHRLHSSARMSLDVPIFTNPIHPPGTLTATTTTTAAAGGISIDHIKKENNVYSAAKFKQPSSPGARLASFLNSLFSQTSSKKKKKSKSGKDAAAADDDAASSARRKRRSSISHFGISRNPNSSAAVTPTKSYKEIRDLADLSKAPVPAQIPAAGMFKTGKKTTDHKSRLSNVGSMPSFGHGSNLGFSDRNSTAETEFRKFSEADDGDGGADTDSSSDLFDLPNHELDFFSNGLPVYGTTNMDRIRIVAPISSTATA
ncbi:protein BIG GRAIN 1-like E [Andrographis paniculata]|uniref:protein BIG GRAIN 1-like E n=1 Tax=Andrographis paniculata TaxID=175694 RepID=UPI0021E8B747|nr:protein BIG GRAIN 1-like E [Andrographis paniculata]